MLLFRKHNKWPVVLSDTAAFVIGATVPLEMPTQSLRDIVSFLKEHRIIFLVLQTQGLEPPHGCGQGLEAYRPFDQVMVALRRIKEAGGVVTYISLDEPLWYAHSYQGKHACKMSVDDIATEVARHLASARSTFPAVRLGDVEPINAFPANDVKSVFSQWYQAFKIAAGEPFAYMQADVLFNKPWQDTMRAVEQLSAEEHITFGVIYDGDASAKSDLEWTSEAVSRARLVESQFHPGQAVFKSWARHPYYVLPESNNVSFTGLVKEYLTARPSL